MTHFIFGWTIYLYILLHWDFLLLWGVSVTEKHPHSMMLLHHTFLLRWYCAGDKQCLFPPYMMLYLELRFIRPEIIVSHSPRESLRYLCVCVCVCVFQVGFHVSSLRRELSLTTLPKSPDQWSFEGMFVLVCPVWSSTISFLVTTQTKALLHRLLSSRKSLFSLFFLVVPNIFHYILWKLLFYEQSMQMIFCSLPHISVLIQSCLWTLQAGLKLCRFISDSKIQVIVSYFYCCWQLYLCSGNLECSVC